MTDDILNKIDKENLERAVGMLKQRLGEKDAAKVDGAMADREKLEKLVSGLGKKEQDMIVRVLNDPKAVRMLLSSPKVTELVRGFLNK